MSEASAASASSQAPPRGARAQAAEAIQVESKAQIGALVEVGLPTNMVRYLAASVVPTISEDWKISQIAAATLNHGWPRLLTLVEDELTYLDEQVVPGTYYPAPRNVFRAFMNCPLDAVRVVWIGQDPYPSGQATGLAFGVRSTDAIPSSLQNIYKELRSNYPGVNLNHGDLTEWSRRGVLLINSTLTVKKEEKLSHKGYWDGFLTRTIEVLNDRRDKDGRARPAVFVLLGKEAQLLKRIIASGHRIVASSHPSGLSAHRGFLGSKLFLQIDAELAKIGHPPMNWNIGRAKAA